MLSAFKNFAVTVLIALLIFGFGAFFAIKFLNTTMNSILTSEKEELSSIVNKGEDEDPSDENNPLTPIDPEEIITGESFSFLLVKEDDNGTCHIASLRIKQVSMQKALRISSGTQWSHKRH